MLASRVLFPVFASLLVAGQGHAAAGAEAASYRSIELRGGGMVSVRYGAERRVTVVVANQGREIRSEADRLVIDRCRGECPGGHRIEIEVVTPALAELAVTDGGTIRLVGEFPPQAEMTASVSDGGTIDMRPLDAGTVSAAVSQGGRILAAPRRQLTAAISDGGIVTYWGSGEVVSTVRRGGVVARGVAADLHAPLARFDPQPLPRLAVLPPPPPKTPPPPRNH